MYWLLLRLYDPEVTAIYDQYSLYVNEHGANIAMD